MTAALARGARPRSRRPTVPALGLALAAALPLACAPDAPPPRSRVRFDPPWYPIAEAPEVTLALDTLHIVPAPGGNARVRLRFVFAQPMVLPPRDSGGAPLRVWMAESDVVTDCARRTTRTLRATLHDSAGREVVRGTGAPGVGAPDMVGSGWAPLCAYLARRRGAAGA